MLLNFQNILRNEYEFKWDKLEFISDTWKLLNKKNFFNFRNLFENHLGNNFDDKNSKFFGKLIQKEFKNLEIFIEINYDSSSEEIEIFLGFLKRNRKFNKTFLNNLLKIFFKYF